MVSTHNRSGGITLLTLALAASMGNFAAEATLPIDEIVVTSRKRSENLQDVPVVVTTFSHETMQRKGISDLGDLTKYTTGLILDDGISKQDSRIVIRGLSPTKGRQNVAVLQDEVDISSLAIGTAGGTFLINPRLFDIERVEIVKGPHSALYGRQAFNGAVNYITMKPGPAFRANVSAEYGSYGKYEGKASLSGPLLTDKLSIGLNAAGWNFDGAYKSIVTGGHLGGGHGGGAAATAVFTPTDTINFTFRSEYASDHFDVEPRLNKIPSTSVALPAAATPFLTPRTSFVINTGSVGDSSGYSGPSPSANPLTPGKDYAGFDRKISRTWLRAEARFDAVTLTSISFVGKTTDTSFQDVLAQGDLSSRAVNAGQIVHFVNSNRLLNEELRLQSSGDNRINWSVGALFWDERSTQNNQSPICLSSSGGCAAVLAAFGTTLPFDFVSPFKVLRATHHYSAYGSADFKITNDLRLSAEIRRTWELEKILAPGTTNQIVGCPNGPPSLFITPGLRAQNADGSVSCLSPGPQALALTAGNFLSAATNSVFWTPRVTLDYKLRPDAMMYVSAALGKKPGGISLAQGALSPTTNRYLPESMWVYEIGAKTSWLQRRLQVNVAAYYQDYSDKQISGFQLDAGGLPVSFTSNASSAEVRGFEAESIFAATQRLTLDFGYTFLDTKYRKFSLLNSSLYNVARAGNCTPFTAPSGTKFCSTDFSGNSLEAAPKHSLQLGPRYKRLLRGEMSWFVEGDAHYQSKRYVDFYNQLYFDSYWNADIRFGVDSPTWSLTAYINNVLDDRTVKTGINDFVDFNRSLISTPPPFVPPAITALSNSQFVFQGNFPDKRQFGLRASYKF